MKNKDTKNKHTKRYLIGTITGISVASAVIIPPLLTYGCNGETKIQKLNETTHELNIKINSLESTINTLKANLEDKNKKLADITAKYESNNVVLKNAKLKLLEYVGNDDVNFAVDENGNGALENSLVDKLKKQIANYQNENKKMQLEIKTLKLDISNLQSQLANANAQNYKLKNRIETLILENGKQIALLKEQIATLEQDKTKFKQANNELVEQLAKSSQRISDLEELIRVKDRVIAQNKAEISRLKNAISKLKDDLASALKQYIKQVLAVKDADKDMLSVVESISNEPDSYFTNEDGSINNARDFLKSKFITQSKNTEIENKLNTLAQLDDNKILNYISDTNGIDKSFLAELQNNLDTLKDEYLAKFRNNEQAYKEYHDILLKKMSDKDKAIKELNTQLENAKSDLTKLVGSNVIGYINTVDYNDINNDSIVGVLNQKLKDKISENETLKQEKASLETQLAEKVKELEAKNQEITELNKTKASYEDILNKAFGTTDADVINKALDNENADELESGKYKEALEKIKELDAKKTQLESDKASLETDKANLEKDIQTKTNTINDYEEVLNKTFDTTNTSDINTALNKDVDSSDNINPVSAGKYYDLFKKYKQAKDELNSALSNGSSLSSNVSSLKAKLRELYGSSSIYNQGDNGENVHTSPDNVIARLRRQIESANSTISSLNSRNTTLTNEKSALQSENTRLNSVVNNNQAEIQKYKALLVKLQGSDDLNFDVGENGENAKDGSLIKKLRDNKVNDDDTVNEEIKTLQNKIEKYKKKLKELYGTSDVDFAQGDLGENVSDNPESVISRLKKDRDTKIADLNSQIQTLKTKNGELSRLVEKLKPGEIKLWSVPAYPINFTADRRNPTYEHTNDTEIQNNSPTGDWAGRTVELNIYFKTGDIKQILYTPTYTRGFIDTKEFTLATDKNTNDEREFSKSVADGSGYGTFNTETLTMYGTATTKLEISGNGYYGAFLHMRLTDTFTGKSTFYTGDASVSKYNSPVVLITYRIRN